RKIRNRWSQLWIGEWKKKVRPLRIRLVAIVRLFDGFQIVFNLLARSNRKKRLFERLDDGCLIFHRRRNSIEQRILLREIEFRLTERVYQRLLIRIDRPTRNRLAN